MTSLRLPDPCLVVLVGPSGSGKSTWAGRCFDAGAIVSSDRLRALVGTGWRDQRASPAAFEVLDLVVEHRLRRRLATVVDSTALEPSRRRSYLAAARRHGVPVVAVLFDVSAAVVRRQNRSRPEPVPATIVSAQLAAVATVREALTSEGFDAIATITDGHDTSAVLVPPALVDAPAAAQRQSEDPMPLTFGLQLPRFAWPGGPAATAEHLSRIAADAEDAGFRSLWVMDHWVQIPQIGREWEDLLEAYTTLGFLAARTHTVTLGALCTGITYRNIAALGKTVATLDVLSGGRAVAGLGLGWFEREHRLYGWDFPPTSARYAMLEDALELLPLLWGKGAPAFHGRTGDVPEAICYPRPLQAHVPILVGGSGERRTLRLVARHADACNLFGDADTVRRKVAVLHRHCADVERDPGEVTITNLTQAQVVGDAAVRPAATAGTVAEQVGRYRAYAEAGVQQAIVSLADVADGGIDRFRPVIDAFG